MYICSSAPSPTRLNLFAMSLCCCAVFSFCSCLFCFLEFPFFSSRLVSPLCFSFLFFGSFSCCLFPFSFFLLSFSRFFRFWFHPSFPAFACFSVAYRSAVSSASNVSWLGPKGDGMQKKRDFRCLAASPLGGVGTGTCTSMYRRRSGKASL